MLNFRSHIGFEYHSRCARFRNSKAPLLIVKYMIVLFIQDCLTKMLLESEYVFTYDDILRLFVRVSGRRDYEIGPYLYHKCDCGEDDQPLPGNCFSF